jgi:hypothetical protein
MKGDIAFAGFVLTAEEWQALDADARAQLIAVATRRGEHGGEHTHDPWLGASFPPPLEPLAEGSGPLEIEPDRLDELDADLVEGEA